MNFPGKEFNISDVKYLDKFLCPNMPKQTFGLKLFMWAIHVSLLSIYIPKHFNEFTS